MRELIIKNEDSVVISKRKIDIAEMFSIGLTGPQIAKELKVSPRTIEVHMYRLRRLLNCNTTMEAVSILLRKGLIK